MKKTILLLIPIALSHFAHAQWVNDENNYTSGQLAIGSSATWAPLTINSVSGANGNVGVSLAFDGTIHPEIGYRFKANGSNYYQVLYNGSHIMWKHYESSNYVPKMSLSNEGNLGLGVASPSSSLDILTKSVSGGEHLIKLKVSDATTDYLTIQNNTGTGGQFIPAIVGFHESDNRLALRLTASTSSSTDNGSNALMIFDSRQINGSSHSAISARPLFQWSNFTDAKMTMLANGNLGLGTESPDSKLAVNGTIHTKEVRVDLNGWSDFVFANDYKLPTLKEVETYISENKHLPEIPSEAEVSENGINLGEMNAKLLQKIEELTLYMIDMNRRMNQLETENTELKEKVQLLEDK
ncbi:hypothetical protein [Marinoscillum luteum]|uniref:Cell wall anchor protein n=1 Tax=Marinoscillum luteum TaxID=861051 RepID=A0ABW7N8B6_9BACT